MCKCVTQTLAESKWKEKQKENVQQTEKARNRLTSDHAYGQCLYLFSLFFFRSYHIKWKKWKEKCPACVIFGKHFKNCLLFFMCTTAKYNFTSTFHFFTITQLIIIIWKRLLCLKLNARKKIALIDICKCVVI